MRSVFLSALFLLLSVSAGALETGVSVEGLRLKNQFEEEVQVTAATKWMLFVADKKSSQMMTDYLLKNSVTPESFAAVYVSDISGMPSLITKMVALPKMKKYPFKLALDSSGGVTKSWPRQTDQVTVIELGEQIVKGVRYLATPEQVAEFVKSVRN
jgi:hypothetical protein